MNAPKYSGKSLEVQASNLLCPLPLLKLKQAIHDHPCVTEFVLLSSDYSSVREVQIFCDTFNHDLVDSLERNGVWSIYIQLENGNISA